MAQRITYRKLKKYKYQLLEVYAHETGLALDAAVATGGGWLKMTKSGRLTVKKGYAWDGPSGPTIDTPNFLRGSMVHDALYQLIREGLLPGRSRLPADKLLRDMCRQDGMSRRRAEYVFVAVRAFGDKAVRPPKNPGAKVLKAP